MTKEHGIDILIVEDNEDTALRYQYYLSGTPYNVTITYSAEEAIALVKKTSYSIIIIDWIMPNMDGLALVKWIRSQGDNGEYPYILMATIKNELADIDELLSNGGDDYIDKNTLTAESFLIRVKICIDNHIDRDTKYKLQTELEESNKSKETVLNTLSIGTLLLNAKNQILYINQTATTFLPQLEVGDNIVSALGDPFGQSSSEDSSEYTDKLSKWLVNQSAHSFVIHTLQLRSDNSPNRCYWLKLKNISIKNKTQQEKTTTLYLEDFTELKTLKLNEGKGESLIGNSVAIDKIRKKIKLLAKGDWNVVIQGETGTGKEIVASKLHANSKRKDKIFLTANCAGFTESLAASLLFGHKKGAFTGAIEDHKGFFESADKGTLFLDEIADLSINTQVMMLRAIEHNEITRVGESKVRKVDVRVIVASNKNLLHEIEAGNFRADLYYRLNTAQIYIPPLRERKGDIVILAKYFLQNFSVTQSLPIASVHNDAIKSMLDYNWPGNVRQLKGVVEFAAMQARDNVITSADLPSELMQGSVTTYISSDSEKDKIISAIKSTNNNYTEAAYILGISRATLYRWLQKYDIKR